jgi:hypothetical protein
MAFRCAADELHMVKETAGFFDVITQRPVDFVSSFRSPIFGHGEDAIEWVASLICLIPWP